LTGQIPDRIFPVYPVSGQTGSLALAPEVIVKEFPSVGMDQRGSGISLSLRFGGKQ